MRRKLEAAGIRPTPQRLAIAKLLFTGDKHVTADQVYDHVRSKKLNVSRATVYNTLNLFTERGLLREVYLDSTRAFFDTNLRPHFHLFYVDSGELVDVEDDELTGFFVGRLPQGVRFQDLDVVVRVYREEAPAG